MLFYFYVLAARWTAPHAIAYSPSFIQWRTHPHQLRIALMLYTIIISSYKKISLCRTLVLTPSGAWLPDLGPQKLFPQGSVHHFVMSKVAGIHQQAKLVDECQMFSRVEHRAIKSWSIERTKVHWIDQPRSRIRQHWRWLKMTEILSLGLDRATIWDPCNA